MKRALHLREASSKSPGTAPVTTIRNGSARPKMKNSSEVARKRRRGLTAAGGSYSGTCCRLLTNLVSPLGPAGLPRSFTWWQRVRNHSHHRPITKRLFGEA
jgi:hypothetical protein